MCNYTFEENGVKVTFSIIEMFFITLFEFIALPQRKDALLSSIGSQNEIVVESSGSIGMRVKGKCVMTHPNDTLSVDENHDWCSNIAISRETINNPWISFTFKNKLMELTGYSFRNGCCRHACCCFDDSSYFYDCCCYMYSFELQGSNDNITWKTIHKVEKEKGIRYCENKVYEFPKTGALKYVRFVQTEEYPGCKKCMQINQLELYGVKLANGKFQDYDGEDESVSIIGKVRSSE